LRLYVQESICFAGCEGEGRLAAGVSQDALLYVQEYLDYASTRESAHSFLKQMERACDQLKPQEAVLSGKGPLPVCNIEPIPTALTIACQEFKRARYCSSIYPHNNDDMPARDDQPVNI
jgi:hypothetical protein